MKFNRKFFLTLFIIVTLIFSYKYFNLAQYTTKDNINLLLINFGNWISIGYLLTFIIAMIFSIPASIFLVVIGSIMGPIWGGLLGIIGCYLASFILFFIARKLNFSWVKDKMGDKWDKFDENITKQGFVYLTIIRSLSVFPFSLISYGSAITSIKTIDFVKATLIGCIPQIIIYVCLSPMLVSRNISTDSLTVAFFLSILWGGLLFFSYKKYSYATVNINLS